MMPAAVRARAVGQVLTYAEEHDLPEPSIVCFYGGDLDTISLHFDTLEDLTAWAMWANEVIVENPAGDSVHHNFHGDVLELTISAVYIDEAPARAVA